MTNHNLHIWQINFILEIPDFFWVGNWTHLNQISNLHVFTAHHVFHISSWVSLMMSIYLSKLVELIFYRVILHMSLILSEWVHWVCINEWIHRAWIFLSDSADKHVFTWVSSLSLYLPEWVHCTCIYLSEFVDHGGGGLILVLSCSQGLLVFRILLTDCLEGMLQLYKKRQNSEFSYDIQLITYNQNYLHQ